MYYVGVVSRRWRAYKKELAEEVWNREMTREGEGNWLIETSEFIYPTQDINSLRNHL